MRIAVAGRRGRRSVGGGDSDGTGPDSCKDAGNGQALRADWNAPKRGGRRGRVHDGMHTPVQSAVPIFHK